MNLPSSLQEILSDSEKRQQMFPVTQTRTYLAHAAVAPLPACVAQAVCEYVTRAGVEGQFEHLHREMESQTRQLAAALLGSLAEEIAFASSTSAALSIIAAGLDWRDGDNLIIPDGDFPANIYPWLALRDRGVEVKFIPRKLDGPIEPQDIARMADARTRLVSLSSIHFSTGMPVDLPVIGEFLHSRGILFCVDAIQSLGAFPCTVEHVDFLAADAHKWLLGPQGIAVLFVKCTHWDRFKPPLIGWKTVRSPEEFQRIKLEYPDSAMRYEPGSLNILGLAGFHAALRLLTTMTVDKVSKQLQSLRSILLPGLVQKGYQVVGLHRPDAPTGITSFKHTSKDIRVLYRSLDRKKIIVSLREDLCGDPCIRVSPHFYNTGDDVLALLESL